MLELKPTQRKVNNIAGLTFLFITLLAFNFSVCFYDGFLKFLYIALSCFAITQLLQMEILIVITNWHLLDYESHNLPPARSHLLRMM